MDFDFDEIDLEESVKAILLSNLTRAETIEARKRQQALIHAISQALHEIFAQYVLMAHCLLLLPVSDQKAVAETVHLSRETCRQVAQYIKGWENIPVASRPLVLENVQKEILTPLIDQLLAAQKKVFP